MAEVILKNVRKVYPNTESKKKKKKDEAVEKKNNLEITDEGVVAVQDFNIDVADKEFIVLVGPSVSAFIAHSTASMPTSIRPPFL